MTFLPSIPKSLGFVQIELEEDRFHLFLRNISLSKLSVECRMDLQLSVDRTSYAFVLSCKITNLSPFWFLDIALEQVGCIEVDHPLVRSSDMYREESPVASGRASNSGRILRCEKGVPRSLSSSEVRVAIGLPRSLMTTPFTRSGSADPPPVLMGGFRMVIFLMCTM
jgi:hypothetical protein